MKSYSYTPGTFGTHTIKITVQDEQFKAELLTQICGNMKGAAVLSSIVSSIEDNDMEFQVSEHNKKYLTFDENAKEGKFAYADRLKMFDGDSVEEYDISEDSRGFGRFVTAIEFIDYKLDQNY